MINAIAVLGIRIERDIAIPMRDGVVLRANLFRPDAPGQYPALIHRTPYGKTQSGLEDFVRAGYAVLSQDIRGRYASEGNFTLFTVPHTGDAEDGYDTVEWTAAQPWCNGKIGTYGASYDAWLQYQCAKLRPPHLEAMSAVSIPMELTDVDWPGAFKPARRVRWWFTTIAPDMRRRDGLPPPHTPAQARAIWDEIEKSSMLGVVPWISIIPYLPPSLAEQVEDWLLNPARQPWQFSQAHCEIAVPNLDFTGWYDHCCSIDHLAGMQRCARGQIAREGTQLVIGPWNHTNLGQRRQGAFHFGLNAQINIRQMQIRWFDYWLKCVDNGVDQEPPVRYYVMGAGKWREAVTFPPENPSWQKYYLSSRGDAPIPKGSGALSLGPRHGSAVDTYVYDPRNPVPTLWDSALFYNISDRRKLDYRSDILHYRTSPLENEVEVIGKPEVVLYAGTSAPDTDFFVRLVDDDPEGPAAEVCYGMVRARHRLRLSTEELVQPRSIIRYRIRMGYTACVFRKGHRIRLEVCSSDFPNHDRNHNTGKNDLLDPEMKIAKQIVYHSLEYPSILLLPTL
ncbi:MAG: CocE/NonD family hydrolase [Anaerolineales bacterium]|nr:MAG: CocE/NonD family hydrolase [Anaerolineales bacterium]